jgi:hypothetical protein
MIAANQRHARSEKVASAAKVSALPQSVKTSLPEHLLRVRTPSLLAKFLGYFSLGLGLWETVAPNDAAEVTGVPAPGFLQLYGVREMAAGVGILASERPAFWLWSRVAGDAMDLATLACAFTSANRRDQDRILSSAAAVIGVGVLDVLCALEHSGRGTRS